MEKKVNDNKKIDNNKKPKKPVVRKVTARDTSKKPNTSRKLKKPVAKQPTKKLTIGPTIEPAKKILPLTRENISNIYNINYNCRLPSTIEKTIERVEKWKEENKEIKKPFDYENLKEWEDVLRNFNDVALYPKY